MEKEKLATALKWGFGLLAVVVAAPLIMLLVQGVVGLAVAGAVGLCIIHGAPVLSTTLTNWKLVGIKWSSRKNPVETLQNIYVERQEALRDFSQRLRDFSTQVKQFEDKAKVFASQYPGEAQKFEAQLDAMRTLLATRMQRYDEVRSQLEEFEAEIRKADAIWQMSQASAELSKAAGMAPDDVYEKIKAETAVDAIQLSLNQSFADLEMALRESDQVKPSAVQVAPVSVTNDPSQSLTTKLVATSQVASSSFARKL